VVILIDNCVKFAWMIPGITQNKCDLHNAVEEGLWNCANLSEDLLDLR